MAQAELTVAGGPGDGRVSSAAVLVLRIPARTREPVTVQLAEPSSVAFSDAIGGGTLDDSLVWVCQDGRFVICLDENRQAKGFPLNDRAAALSVRLGYADRAWLADLRGDALVVGVDATGDDRHIPMAVLVAACRCGLDVRAEEVTPTPSGR
jgi:hypothetical protein